MVKGYPVPCTKDEIDNLINASMDNEFLYMLFMVAKTTGRRIGEYYDVMVKDVIEDPDGTKIMKTKVLKRRMKVEKDAILSEEVYRIVKKYILSNKLKLEDYLFRKYSYRHIQHLTVQYAKRANISHKVSFHNFRHYFVTELLRQGWHYDKIAKLTGHSTPQTLINYDHVVAKDIKADALEALKTI